jgi:hypothetical protein
METSYPLRDVAKQCPLPACSSFVSSLPWGCGRQVLRFTQSRLRQAQHHAPGETGSREEPPTPAAQRQPPGLPWGPAG